MCTIVVYKCTYWYRAHKVCMHHIVRLSNYRVFTYLSMIQYIENFESGCHEKH